MATAWGNYVRVSGPGASLTISGTIWGHIRTDSDAAGGEFPFAFGNFAGATVSAGGVSATVSLVLAGLYYRKLEAFATAGYTSNSAGYIIGTIGIDPEREPEYEFEPPPLPIGIGPTEATWTYTISYTGLVLKRRHGISKPDARQHMWAGDAHGMDAWHMTPDYQATVTISGPSGSASASTDVRRDWPEFAGMTDAEIGDEVFDVRVGISIPSNTWDRQNIPPSEETARVTVSGCNFDGIVTSMAGGPSGDAEATSCRVEGSGPTLTYTQYAPGPASVEGYGVGFLTHPSARYAWDLKFCKFDDGATGEALDPIVDAGFLRATDDVGGTEPALYAASALPDYTPLHPVEVLPGKCDHRVLPTTGDVWHPGLTMQIAIDRAWALEAGCCPGRVADRSEEFGLIETLDDLAVIIDMPGVNRGLGGVDGGNRNTVYTLSSNEPALTLVLDKDDPEQTDPLARWVQSGQLVGHNDPAHTDRLLRWYFPPSLYATVPSPKGDIELATQTRYWERGALLPQQLADLPAPNGKDWRWIWQLYAKAEDEVTAGTAEPTYAEDKPWSWQASGYASLTVNKPAWLKLTLAVTLRYSWPTVTDPRCTDGEDRADGYLFERNEAEATYTVELPAATSGPYYDGTKAVQHDATAVIDLACPDSGSTPRLFHIDSIIIADLGIPTCDRTDKPAGFEEGGVIEVYADATKGIKLCRDTGTDHTGRNVAAAPRADLSAADPWDWDSDFQAIAAIVDGAIYAADLPDEPALNSGPENGIAGIEHYVSSTGAAGRLDYARAITDAAILGWNDRLSMALDDEALAAMVSAAGPGGALETLSGGYVYWLACDKYATGAEGQPADTVSLSAAVRVRSWLCGFGVQSTISAVKPLYGRARALLKVNRGRRRLTPDYLTDAGVTLNAVIWRAFTYEDSTGATIAAPSGRPAAGHWEHFATEPVADNLSKHGMWSSPPLPPSRTYIDTGKPGGASAQTDQMVTTYAVQLWTSDAWESVDFNDRAARDAMLLDDDCWGGWEMGPRATARLWQTAPFDLQSKWLGRIDLDVSRPGVLSLARPSHVRYPTETATHAAGLLLDGYSPQHAGGHLPYRSTHGGDYDRPAVVALDTGRVVVACRNVATDTAEVRTYQLSGIGGSTVQALTGHTLASVTAHPATRGALIIARRESDGVFRVAPLEGQTMGEWRTVGEGDARHAALWVLPSGRLLAGLPRADDTVVLASDNGGATWSEHSTVTGVTLPSGSSCRSTGAPIMLGRDTGGRAVAARLSGDEWIMGGTLAACDPVAGGITEMPDGQWLAAVVKGGKLHTYTSADLGANWSEVTT